jgi:hypothetical protein
VLDLLARSPRGAVFLDRDPGLPPAPEPDSTSIRVVESEPGRHHVRVLTDTPAILVLNRSRLPGWSVTVNDYPFELFTANRLAVAVAVPAGESKVVFTYAPPRSGDGLRLSLAGLAVLGGLTFFFYRSSRPGRAAREPGNQDSASP